MTSNVFTRTYPRGFDTEVLSFDCLERVHQATVGDTLYREHVTNYLHDFPEKFIIENISHPHDYSHLRICVDTPADLQLVRTVYEKLYPENPEFGYQEIFSLFDANRELAQVNAVIPQKKIFRRKTRD